jgi:hypothetical protein
MIVVLVFLQALIGIIFNFLAQLGELCKKLFQDIFVGILIESIRGYHVTGLYYKTT